MFNLSKKIKSSKANKKPITGAYITQPISQADSREPQTRVALPDDHNVALNREWIIENQK